MNSSYLNHFIQPDSIIPDYTNPQSWNRYSYVGNNPVNFNDPTGHMQDEGGTGGCDTALECDLGGDDSNEGADNDGNSNTCIINCSGSITIGDYSVNDWLWDNIPSAFGIHGGISVQAGTTIEPGFTPAELLLLFNWRSGEISLFYSFEGFIYLGTPSVLAGNLYGGWTTVEGLSRNQFYEGQSLFAGLTGSLDGFAKLGGILVSGKAITPESASKGEIPLLSL